MSLERNLDRELPHNHSFGTLPLVASGLLRLPFLGGGFLVQGSNHCGSVQVSQFRASPTHLTQRILHAFHDPALFSSLKPDL